MRDEQFKDLVGNLWLLDENQRRQVLGHLKGLNADKPVAISKKDKHDAMEGDWLLQGIAWEAARRGKLARADTRLLAHMNTLPVYQKKSEDAKVLLLRGFSSEPGGRAKDMLGRIAARCLFEHLKYIKGLPVGAVLANVDKVGEAVDASFPGYIESQVMESIVRGAAVFLGN